MIKTNLENKREKNNILLLPRKTKLNIFPTIKLSSVNKKNTSINKHQNSVYSNLVGVTKHYPPANKEWTNSVYAYNKKSLRSLSVKDDMAKRLIKSFFNLHTEKTIARSKRMRSLIRKSTAKKLFISKPEIKQTSDKVIITVYTFDREKQFLLRKLYFKVSKWEGFKKINLKLKLREKALRKKIKIINKRVLRKAYFSGYDKWRVRNQLRLIANKKEKVIKALEIRKANHYLENTSEKEMRLLANFKKLGVKRFNYPIKKKIIKAKWLENYAFIQGYNKVISLNIKKLLKKKIKVEKRIKTRKGIKYIKVPRYKKVTVYKRLYFRSKDGYTNINYFLKRKRNFYPKKVNYIIKPSLRNILKTRSLNRLIKKRNLMFIKRRLKKTRKNMPLFGFNHYNQINFSKYKVKSKRFLNAKKILLYFYIAHVLSLFKIKILSFEDTLKVSRKKLKKLKKEDYDILEKPKKRRNIVISKKEKSILIKKKVSFYVRRFQKYKLPFDFNKKMHVNFYFKGKKFSVLLKNVSFNSFTRFLLALLKSMLITSKSIERVKNSFKNFSNKYFLNVFYKSLFYVKDKKKLEKNLNKFNRNVLIINSLVKLAINQTKFGKFLPQLKLLINKIYNKKAELNIVNLKSPHLNTDIFTEAVAVKLKKRVGLLRVMRRSLQLVKLPSRFRKISGGFNGNKLEILNKFKSLNLSNLRENMNLNMKKPKWLDISKLKLKPRGKALRKIKNFVSLDSLQAVLKTLYPRSFTFKSLMVNNKQRFSIQNPLNKKTDLKLNKLSAVFNDIKYKWVSGVRLEAAGRLTRRYTASRSVFKFRQKGSLKNSLGSVFLRNISKSNLQHSFLASKKRIGAFGLNTWMSSN